MCLVGHLRGLVRALRTYAPWGVTRGESAHYYQSDTSEPIAVESEISEQGFKDSESFQARHCRLLGTLVRRT